MMLVGLLRPQNMSTYVFFSTNVSFDVAFCLNYSASSMIRKQAEAALLFSHLHKSNMAANRYIYGLTTLNKPKSREVSTNDGIITQNIFNAAVSTSSETK